MSMDLRVYLEIGKKKTFAAAVDWPGWSRGARDEAAALQSLVDYGPRYARVARDAGLTFEVPADPAALAVVERLEGNATTDFGAPGLAPSFDAAPLDDDGLARLRALLEASWRALDTAAAAAAGRELTKGPRGGGRELDGIVEHVLGADGGYLRQLGWSFKQESTGNLDEDLRRCRAAILEALPAAARGELPAVGPRGGQRWTPRYYVRRAAWHVLDHAWEIEDRSTPGAAVQK